MRRDLIIVNDFYDDPDAVVRYARSLKYCTPYNAPDDEARGQPIIWRTSVFRPAHACPFKSSSALIAKLESLTGERIDMVHWNRDFPLGPDGYPSPDHRVIPRTAWWNTSFNVSHRLIGADARAHNHNVFDNWNAVGNLGWAGIVYLCKSAPRDAGLTTYRNRHGRNDDRHTFHGEDWQPIDSYANVYNRMVLHRGYLPHSGAPGWGSTVEDGRMFQTFFFSTLTPRETAPVSAHDLQIPVSLLTST